jgi:hypothetical protein
MLAFALARSIGTSLHGVTVTPSVLALPTVTIPSVALLAALPAEIQAVRIDPVAMLRLEWSARSLFVEWIAEVCRAGRKRGG